MDTNESKPDAGAINDDGLEPQAAVPSAVPRKKWRRRSIVIVSAVGALLLASAATGIATAAQVVTTDSRASSGGTVSGGTTSGGTTFAPGRQGSGSFGSRTSTAGTSTGTAATNAQEVGVVTIDTVLKYQGAEAAGTGIILSSSGEILTNNHVIDGATSISVTVVSTGQVYVADVVGTDASSDIAVLQLEGASGLSTATTDTTSQAAVADSVTAVGNAGGTGTLTAAQGTVTALNKSITASSEGSSASEALTGLIETDANVVAGDSGGPLYESNGEVIGIDTAASSGSSTVTGYAIAIGTALSIADQIETGNATSTITIGYPGFLGVEIGSSTTGAISGATVGGVVAGTPAATAGLVAGDTITAVGGSTVTSASQLSQLLGGYKPGDSVTIGWTDTAGAAHSASVVLVQGPAN
ncbi:MAG: hypothetical protein JWO18_2923 [Microbacteriaceae bacterium]|jgi:S1-C subfamily serine protease|nr:hypothetical protein [Microbacteriaceae bacterium]